MDSGKFKHHADIVFMRKKMKKLQGLAVLFAVLYMCVPAYGDYSLIYNVSCTVKGINITSKASIPLKAYLVLRLDNTDNLLDANLIMYGNDSHKHKVYVEHDYDAASGPYQLDASLFALGDFVAFKFACSSSPFDFEGIIFGNAVLKDVGVVSTRRIASSMTGTLMISDDMLLDPNDSLMGTGNFSATLFTTVTKYANMNSWTQDEIINGNGSKDGLIQRLKGYSEATLP
jgi:hypothetical protein